MDDGAIVDSGMHLLRFLIFLSFWTIIIIFHEDVFIWEVSVFAATPGIQKTVIVY